MSSYTGIECGLCRKNHAVKVLVCKECRDVIAAAWPHARRRLPAEAPEFGGREQAGQGKRCASTR